MGQIPNFPSNRETQPPPKNVRPIVREGVSQRNPVASRVRNVGNSLFEEIILPALKSMVFEFFSSGARTLIFGQDDSMGRRGHTVGRSPQNSYNRQYRGSQVIRRPVRRQQMQEPPAAVYEDILFVSRVDAQDVLDQMRNLVTTYGSVSLGDLYTMCSLGDKNYTHQRYGWTNLDGVRVETISDGHIIGLPPIEFFN